LTAEQALTYACELLARRYAGAELCIAAGTIVRDESATAHSDLDLVVRYPWLPCAFRESFRYRSMPVEAFVHDHETIQAFMDRDHRNAHPAIIHMVATGRVVGGSGRLLDGYRQDAPPEARAKPRWHQQA
jgi:hypothetical protein